MHRFSTTATKSSALTAFPSVGLLNVLQRVRLRWPSVVRLARSALSSLRYKNVCIIRAKKRNFLRILRLTRGPCQAARTMHKFSTAATKSSTLPVLRSVGLLNVLQRVRLRWPPSARGATHSGQRFRRFVTRTYEWSGPGAHFGSSRLKRLRAFSPRILRLACSDRMGRS